MLEYGDRMLDLRERKEEFNMRDDPPFIESATYYVTGAELKEAVNIAFGQEMKRLEASVKLLDRAASMWIGLAVFFAFTSLALCVLVSWLW
jgi:hypothetical protein